MKTFYVNVGLLRIKIRISFIGLLIWGQVVSRGHFNDDKVCYMSLKSYQCAE